jgi:hypothetical protein
MLGNEAPERIRQAGLIGKCDSGRHVLAEHPRGFLGRHGVVRIRALTRFSTNMPGRSFPTSW